MITLTTTASAGALLGGVFGAYTSRIGDEIADAFENALTSAFSEQAEENCPNETSLYESMCKREFWEFTAAGAASGALIGVCAHQVSSFAQGIIFGS